MSVLCQFVFDEKMPKGPRVQQNQNAQLHVQSQGQGIGKTHVVPGNRVGPGGVRRKSDEKPHCPICIEPLDATEMVFKPCPCGYRVCLFCYEKIRKECNNQCPGCRTAYGANSAPPSPGQSSHPPQILQIPQNSQNSQKIPSQGPSMQWPSLSESNPPVQRPPIPKTPPVNGVPETSNPSIAHSSQSSGDLMHVENVDLNLMPGGAMSEWPSLQSSTSTGKSGVKIGGGRVGGKSGVHNTTAVVNVEENGVDLRRTSISKQGENTVSSSQSLARNQQQQGSGGGQVRPPTTVRAEIVCRVGDSRKPVCVPLDLSALPGVEKDPEASEILERTRVAIQEGRTTSKEAAGKLVMLLEKMEHRGSGGNVGNVPRINELKKRFRRRMDCGTPDAGKITKEQEGGGNLGESRGNEDAAVRLEDTPSTIVAGPVLNAVPISPPSMSQQPESVQHLQGKSPFSRGPAGFLPNDLLDDPSESEPDTTPAPAPSLWTDKGLPGIQLQARQSLTHTVTASLSQPPSRVTSLGTYDLFRLSQQLSHEMGVETSQELAMRRSESTLGGGGYSLTASQQLMQAPPPPMQAHHPMQILQGGGLAKEVPRNGYRVSDMQYITSSPSRYGPPPGMTVGSPMQTGSPGMWVGGSTGMHNVQMEMPYVPPDIQAARVGAVHHRSPPGMYRPLNVQGVQGVQQQIANFRLQDSGQVPPAPLLHNWK